MAEKDNIPLWVKRAAEETAGGPSDPALLLGRIDELLYDGWQPAAVARELGIPEQQERSLELYGRKYSARRVLAPIARLREALADGMADLSPKLMQLLQLSLSQALSPESKQSARDRTGELLGKFAELLLIEARKTEERGDEATQRRSDAARTVERLSDEAIAQIRSLYGLPVADGK